MKVKNYYPVIVVGGVYDATTLHRHSTIMVGSTTTRRFQGLKKDSENLLNDKSASSKKR